MIECYLVFEHGLGIGCDLGDDGHVQLDAVVQLLQVCLMSMLVQELLMPQRNICQIQVSFGKTFLGIPFVVV